MWNIEIGKKAVEYYKTAPLLKLGNGMELQTLPGIIRWDWASETEREYCRRFAEANQTNKSGGNNDR